MDISRALEILNLSQDASGEDIKKAYRCMAKTWHPDKFQNPQEKHQAEERIKDINQAYGILKACSASDLRRSTSKPKSSSSTSASVRSETQNAEYFYRRAVEREAMEHYSEAIDDCTQAIRMEADYLDAYKLRRDICLTLGYENRARSDATHISRISLQRKAHSDTKSHASSPPPETQHQSTPGRDDSKATGTESALHFCKLALENFEKNQIQDAIKNCNRAIRLDPNFVEAYKLRRKIFIKLGYKDRVLFDTQHIMRLEHQG